MKNRLWKKWMALLLAAAMTAGAAGCGSKSGDVSENKKNEADAKTEGAEAEESGKKDVTITVAASQSWIADIDRVLAKEFTEKTGIKVDFQLNLKQIFNLSFHISANGDKSWNLRLFRHLSYREILVISWCFSAYF